MNGRDSDIIIAGGGLAGGLMALALARLPNPPRVLLLEAGATLGGNHRWSWFASDLAPEGTALMAPFRKSLWDGGHEVHFGPDARRLAAPYRSLTSEDFDAALHRELAPGTIRTGADVAELDAGGVTLGDGERIRARAVIDCRGFVPSPHLAGGWQVFMGRHLHTTCPHGVEAPIIMDATVEQRDGYRFVYVLPLGAHDLFVEDTYFNNSPLLDRAALSRRLDAYAAAHGWGGTIEGSETGVLPVITGGNFAAFQAAQRIPGVAVAGARAGFGHPLTSYTLPFAVETALAVASESDLPGGQLAALLESRARHHWGATRFYRLLGRMLFASAPTKRQAIFSHFYRLPDPLIERFYAARSTLGDQARILCGRPPLPISRALGALLHGGQPLAERQAE